MTYQASYKETHAIEDFIRTAQSNGIRVFQAALPRKHPMIANRTTRELRTVGEWLAFGYDELGNTIALTKDLRVIQILQGEFEKPKKTTGKFSDERQEAIRQEGAEAFKSGISKNRYKEGTISYKIFMVGWLKAKEDCTKGGGL